MMQGSERQTFQRLATAAYTVTILSLQEERLSHRLMDGKPIEGFDPLVAYSDIYLLPWTQDPIHALYDTVALNSVLSSKCILFIFDCYWE